jgi:hypothetical protein
MVLTIASTRLAATAAVLLRLVAGTLCLALGAGAVPGAGALSLLPVLTDALDAALAGGLVFGLGWLLLVGLWTRPVTASLAGLLLWSALLGGTGAPFLLLALLAALGALHLHAARSARPRGLKVWPDDPVEEPAAMPLFRSTRQPAPRPLNIFRDDFDLILPG